jgi:hypothetical protein
VASARAEVAWLRGDSQGVADATEVAFALAGELDAAGVLGELALWRRRAGISDNITAAVAEPYALQLAGDWEAAAALWATLGRPYDAALALADGDADARRRALRQLHDLGAGPPAAIVARRLRARGARGAPARAAPRDARQSRQPHDAPGRGAGAGGRGPCATVRSPNGSSCHPRRSTITSARS